MTGSVVGRRGMVGSLLALFALASFPAGAVSRVTHVIDGLPQVIAPQQIIVSCDPGALPLACTNALALVGASICVLQMAALVGLALSRDWARVLATIVCVAWSLTCIGLPLSLAVISALWTRKKAPLG